MDGIKIEVTGNIARVIERPARITAGTVGLPIEFSFDNQWEGLSKTAVFKAGCTEMIVENLDVETIAPWETTANPNVWLSIGVYGVNADGSVAIPTIWANVCVICEGTNPEGDVSTAPTPPVWQRLWNAIGNLLGLTTNAKGNLVEAINEVNSIALAGGIESDPTLTQSGKAADAKATGDKIKSLTATDVGARPADWMPTASDVGARPATWTPTATDVGARPNDWMPTADEVGARPNTWLPTIADIDAAPAGYGLGTSGGRWPGNLNEAINGGFYTFGSSTLNRPSLMSEGVVIVASKETNWLVQIACSTYDKTSGSGILAVRRCSGADNWGEWEYINPPMVYGVEYRTTERDNGEPVYTKRLNLGALPNASTSQYSFGFNETVTLTDVNVRTSSGSQIPHYLNGNGVGTVSYYNNMNTIWVTTTENRSSNNLVVKLKYVKE